MATVRFSKDLVEAVTHYAKMKMQPPVTKAKETKPDNSWGQRIYDIMFADAKSFIAQAPDGWLATQEKIVIGKVGLVYANLEFTFAAPMPWPHKFVQTQLARKEVSYGSTVNLENHPAWSEFQAEVVAYNERVKAATARQTEFVEAVKKVMGAYSTLAPALKAWPPLWELIPEGFKDKHREIVERTKAEVVLNVDIGKLTAMSTAAKFGL